MDRGACRLQSVGLHRVGHNWSDLAHAQVLCPQVKLLSSFHKLQHFCISPLYSSVWQVGKRWMDEDPNEDEGLSFWSIFSSPSCFMWRSSRAALVWPAQTEQASSPFPLQQSTHTGHQDWEVPWRLRSRLPVQLCLWRAHRITKLVPPGPSTT